MERVAIETDRKWTSQNSILGHLALVLILPWLSGIGSDVVLTPDNSISKHTQNCNSRF